MNDTIIVAGTVATLVGAIAAAITSLITSRATSRKTETETKVAETKLPGEVDSIIAQATDTAVLAMQKVIESQDDQIAQLNAARAQDAKERAQDRARMAELEKEVADLREKVATAERHLAEARDAGERVAGQLRQALHEQDQRRSKN